MKSKCSFILKASTALVLALLMLFGTVATSVAAVVDNAATGRDAEISQTGADSGTVYYDHGGTKNFHLYFDGSQLSDKLSNYTYKYLLIGKSDYTSVYSLTKISNTELYYYNLTNDWTGGAISTAFIGTNTSLSSGSTAYSTQWGKRKTGAQYTSNYTFYGNTRTYLFYTNSSGTMQTPKEVATGSDSYSTLKGTVYYKTQTADVGSTTYANSTEANVAKIKLKAGYWKGKSATLSEAESTSGTTQYDNSVDAVATTLSYSDIGAAYEFMGFYRGTSSTGGTMTSLSTSGTSFTTYSQTYTTEAQSVYYFARFRKKPTVTVSQSGATGTVTIGGSSVTDSTYVSTGTNTAVTIAAPTSYVIGSVTGAGWTATSTASTTSWTGTINTSADATLTITYEVDGKPNLDSISDVSKTVNDTSFNVPATVTNYAKKSGTVTATVTSGTTAVATVTSPITLSSSSFNIPVTVKGPGTSTITVTLKDGSTTLNSQTFDVTVAEPTFTISAKTIDVTAKNTALTISQSPAPSSGTTYTSNNSTYISVNSSGQVTAAETPTAEQTATITGTATYGCGYTKTATATVTLNAPTLVVQSSKTSGYINDTATASIKSSTNPTVSDSTVTAYKWTTSDSSIVALSSTTAASPTLTFKKNGTATINLQVTYKKTSLKKTSANVSITVNKPTINASNVEVAQGDTKQLSATTSNPNGLTIKYAEKTAATGFSVTEAGLVSVTTAAANNATYTVVATAYNASNEAVQTKEITVTAKTPSLDVKDGTTSKKDGTVYTTVNTPKTLNVSANFSGDLTAKSSDITVATVALSADNKLTITPKAKGTCKVYVSTDPNVSTTGVDIAATAAAMPEGIFKKVIEYAATGAVDTQTVQFTVNVADKSDVLILLTKSLDWWQDSAYIKFTSTDSSLNVNWTKMTLVGTNDTNSGQKVYGYKLTAEQYSKFSKIQFKNASGSTSGTGYYTAESSTKSNAYYLVDSGMNNTTLGTWTHSITIPQVQIDDKSIDLGANYSMPATKLNDVSVGKYKWTSGTTSVATVTADTATTASTTVTSKDAGTSTITVKAYASQPSSGWNSWEFADVVAGTDIATVTVVAENKTVSYSAQYSDNGSTWNNASATQGSFTVMDGNTTVNSGASLAYNTTLTLTATPASGYALEGIYKSNDSGSTWTKVSGTTLALTENYQLEARFIKVFKLSAFDSYELKNNSTVTFVTAPPKSIKVKHGDTTYTYSYDGTKAAGNPDSPDGTKPAALPIADDTYGQGNYIQYYAGDEITLTYSAMASSEILKGVFYNNEKDFYVNKPTTDQFVAHSHPTTPAIYMNSAYYTSAELGSRDFSGVTADNDAHSIKFTGTQDYKNIDVEIGTKRKVYFSDYTNAVITSKNTDDYYYDGEALSVTGDQLTVAAAMSTVQTNKIDNSASSTNKPGFYRANADGSKGTALTSTEISNLGLSISTGTSTSTSSANGTALVISGNMPAYDLYIDLNMQNSYTLKLGTLVVSSLGESGIERLRQKATTISIAGNTTLSASTTAKVTTSTTSVNTGSSATLTVSGISSGYMFVGWYWGDDSAPDYDKGYISDKQTLSYTPKKGGTIWAVGTKELFINGSKYITGKATDWYSENNTWKNQQMKFDPDRGTQGSYYWEITDTMFASAGNDFKYTTTSGTSTTEGRYFKGDDNYYYWNDNDDKYHGKAFFQLLDTETGVTDNNREVWKSVYSFLENADGTTHGKILKRDMNQAGDTDYQRREGQGFIDFAESRYSGYSSPLRIYLDAATKALDVVATAIYSNLYVSNGYNVGSTLKTDAVTVEPVVDGVVKTSGQTGYFTIKTEGSGWDPDHEGHVAHYIPQKKGATVRITKKAGGSDKIVAFLIYDIDNKTVRAEKNITKGTTANSKTPYYIDLTLANERQNLYIVPIVEEAGSKVTITFDATQLNRKQWGDIVTAYSWYKTTNAAGLGEYPGQPMIPSDDMSTWTATFAATKGGNELAGITFTNYVDGIHSWLGCSGVMGEVSDHKTGEATGGIINVYNHVDSGTGGEYSRTNYKAQTYDYHEPIALYDRYKGEDSVNITFQMKDGNSSLISWRHTEFDDNNILNLPSGWGTLNWEYLTNAKGDQYIDMNGNPLGANNKPTATFYVASKGQVVYNNSTMDYVFHGGHNYEMKGYTATYSDPTGSADRGSYTKSALASGQWSSDITYGGVSGLDMKYAVQWYVYDAQGNYITTVLSAGIADLSSNNVDTFIAKELEDKGYAVDGKSVAICYDKPRYMYGDWTGVTNSANNINCGPNFDAYRFEGQWIAAAQSDVTKVNVEVAMMTDSGEVLAHSNTAGYGNASASLRSGITFGKSQYATAATDGSWAQTAATDAKLNGIALNASAQNFIGWYYYDANTGEFTKANYTSNENFYPNYTNKDVTYYAVYRASAVYNYIYQGREGERTYSAAGNDLTPAEMEAGTNQNKVQYSNHEADVLAKLPVGIGIFKKNIDFSAANAGSWDKDSTTDYILKLSGFSVTIPEYTLTYTYKKTNGSLETKTVSAAYNTTAVNLTSINGGTPVTAAYGTDEHKFLGWYEHDGDTIGDLLSTQANYGMRLTRNQSIIAVYEGDGTALPTDGWTAHIDENVLNKELTTSTTGVFYNDTIVRVRNSSDVKATLPGDAKIGVLVVTKNGKTTKEPDAYSKDQLTTLADGIASGETKSTKSGLVITNMQANTQTSFNRTDIAVRADYKSTVGAQYCVYAYIKIGNNYYFSAHSAVKTYE